MNEVHWSDPEFQKWERAQLGGFREFVVHRESFGEEPVRFYRHDFPRGFHIPPDISGVYRNPMISLKEDEHDTLTAADSTRVEPRIEWLEIS